MVYKDGMIPLELDQEELTLVCAALEAVSPTGGGSTQFHLIGRLRLMAFPVKVAGKGTDPSDDAYHKKVGHLQRMAHLEYLEVFQLKVVPRDEFASIEVSKPEYPVEIAIRYDGEVLWVNVDGKCVLRICQIPALILDDNRDAKTIRGNLRKLDNLAIKGEPI